MASLDYFYADYGEVEEAFLAAIDTSSQPRGPDMLYDVVSDLRLGQAARVLALGCSDGKGECRVAAARSGCCQTVVGG